jgi:hypothetical protein
MEALFEQKGIEVDITRDDCMKKKSNFYQCVVERKNELTKTLNNDEFLRYAERVNKIQIDCFSEKGTPKCNTFYTFTDIKY